VESANQESATTLTAEPAWKTRFNRFEVLLERLPWLLPLLSFGWGWISFALVTRGEDLARTMALLVLVGMPWLLVEPFLRKYLERKMPGRFTELALIFITQSLQQELLFFSLPLLFGALQLDVGQIIFFSIVSVAALISTIDPLYNRKIAAHPAVHLAFQGFCSWLAALVLLPMVLHVPLERAAPTALALLSIWLLLTLPRCLSTLTGPRQKMIWVGACFVVPLAIWLLRDNIPAAGLSVREARIARTIENLTPGPSATVISNADLQSGVIAFVAIRAPMQVAQSVVFEWRHNGSVEHIPAEIHGGNSAGWRTWSRKQRFPESSQGKWTVDVLTPQGQLLKRLHFTVQ
jgi:uncharacterized protein DUF5924/DUF2914 family protein